MSRRIDKRKIKHIKPSYCKREKAILESIVTSNGNQDWIANLQKHIDNHGGIDKYIPCSNEPVSATSTGEPCMNYDENGFCHCGDINGDGVAGDQVSVPGYNVLDIVSLANCVLNNNCSDNFGCTGDMNADGGYNVLDIVTLANCILAANCHQHNQLTDINGEKTCSSCKGAIEEYNGGGGVCVDCSGFFQVSSDVGTCTAWAGCGDGINTAACGGPFGCNYDYDAGQCYCQNSSMGCCEDGGFDDGDDDTGEGDGALDIIESGLCCNPSACNNNGMSPAAHMCPDNNIWYNSLFECAQNCGGLPPGGTGYAKCGGQSCTILGADECVFPVYCECGGGGTCPDGITEESFINNTYQCSELMCTACNLPNNPTMCNNDPLCNNELSDGSGSVCKWTNNSECAGELGDYGCGPAQEYVYLEGCFSNPTACNYETCPSDDQYTICVNTECIMPVSCTYGATNSEGTNGPKYCPDSDDTCPCGNKNEALVQAFGDWSTLLINDFYDLGPSCHESNECGNGVNGWCSTPGDCDSLCIPPFKQAAINNWFSALDNTCNVNVPLSDNEFTSCLLNQASANAYCGGGCEAQGGICKVNQYGYPGKYVCKGEGNCINDGVGDWNAGDEGCWSAQYEGHGMWPVELQFSIDPLLGCYWSGGIGYPTDSWGGNTWSCGNKESEFWDYRPNNTPSDFKLHGHCYSPAIHEMNDEEEPYMFFHMPYCSDKYLYQCGFHETWGQCGPYGNLINLKDYYAFGGGECSCDPCAQLDGPYIAVDHQTGMQEGWCMDVFIDNGSGLQYGMTVASPSDACWGCDNTLCSDEGQTCGEICNTCGGNNGGGEIALCAPNGFNSCGTSQSYEYDEYCDCDDCSDQCDMETGEYCCLDNSFNEVCEFDCCHCEWPKDSCCDSRSSNWYPGITDETIHKKLAKQEKKQRSNPTRGNVKWKRRHNRRKSRRPGNELRRGK